MMLLPNVRPGGQTRYSDWSYTSNAFEDTDGIWLSRMQRTHWVAETSSSVIVQKSDAAVRKGSGQSWCYALVVQNDI
jgi:hypothetical protein